MGESGRRRHWVAALAGLLLLFGADAALSSRLPPMRGLQLVPVASGLEFPVAGLTLPGTDRMWIAERSGIVRELRGDSVTTQPVLDITELVVSDQWEQGLVGMALHPDYPRDRRLFVSYTDERDAGQVIASYRLDAAGVVDEATRMELLRVAQVSPVHQGGTIRFGPDGMLWIGFGDGGHDGTAAGASTQDPEGHGQNPWTLQGTLVRIDVDAAIPFAIPSNNPFAADGRGAPEVWAYGLRNPWSLWFDSARVYIGEVGFDRWEEINVLDLESQAGSNLGWSVLEGPDCLRSPDCDREGMTPPALALPRSPGTCAIVVGPPYRGVAMPELTGSLVYGDLCGAWLRTVSTSQLVAGISGTTWLEAFATQPTLTAFFEGPHGEWHLLTIDGLVYRLDPVR